MVADFGGDRLWVHETLGVLLGLLLWALIFVPLFIIWWKASRPRKPER
ncbi:hypothetical protein AB0H34_34940 [Saccharopolyspora shandongensis]